MNRVLRLGLALCLTVAQGAFGQQAFESGRAAFGIGVNNELYPYALFSTFVNPNERTVLRVVDPGSAEFSLTASAGNLEATDARRWVWIAPRTPGRATINVTRGDGSSLDLQAFLQVPASEIRSGSLRGYPIGRYPPALRGEAIYDPPAGYVEVQPGDLSVRLSPHFALGQFLTDPSDRYPKFVVIRERLLLKLEALLERTNQRGIRADSFGIVVGYRTPMRNAEVGGAEHSRHIYGGAAGIIVDREPADGLMDDLNGDGVGNAVDVRILFDIADALTREQEYRHLQGGLAVYPATPQRGPYLHVDARGTRARWTGDVDQQSNVGRRRALHRRDFPTR